jgi:hypothetical protein
MRGDGGNHNEKLGPMGISCGTQFTIPDTIGTTPDLAGKNTNTTSSKPNQASRTPDFSYALVSSISFPSSSRIARSLTSSRNTELELSNDSTNPDGPGLG